jgi:hypothetical protein
MFFSFLYISVNAFLTPFNSINSNNKNIYMNALYDPPQPVYNIDSINNEKSNFDYKLLPVQGGSLKTWSFKSPDIDRVQVILSSEGRPLDANVELWHGPDNTPCKLRIYSENGNERPFSTVIETPRGPNTISIKNVGQIEFPLEASVFGSNMDKPNQECISSSKTIQGGALKTYPFDPRVDSVQILLKTDGRPLNSRIELMQGPNNNKQVIELFAEDGCDRPFFCILETPGSGNVIRVVNTAPVEFPLLASVVANSYDNNFDFSTVVSGTMQN